MAQNNLPEPGEFTRIFKRTHLGAPSDADAEKNTGEGSGIFPAAEAPSDETLAQPSASPSPTGTPLSSSGPANSPAASAPGPSSNDPGEFTQYFKGGLPAKFAPSVTPQRPLLGVQRPNTPVPASRNLTGDNSGSFTEKFAARGDSPVRKADEFGVRNPRMGPAPDLSKGSVPEEKSTFDYKAPSKKDAPGEYTALFGRGNLPPAPSQSAVAPPPGPPIMSDSPNGLPGIGGLERTRREIPVITPTPSRPSEFTIMSGGRSESPGAGSGAAPDAVNANNPAGTPKIPVPVNVSINPVNPLAAIPSTGAHLPGASANASMSGANVSTAFGSAGLQAPTVPPLNPAAGAAGAAAGAGTFKLTNQAKLILFFGILAILAVILVVVVVVLQKN